MDAAPGPNPLCRLRTIYIVVEWIFSGKLFLHIIVGIQMPQLSLFATMAGKMNIVLAFILSRNRSVLKDRHWLSSLDRRSTLVVERAVT